MSEIRDGVIEAVAQKINDSRGVGKDYALGLVQEVIGYAEETWPHSPPGHDYRSTTASQVSLGTQAAGYKYFGFGRGPAVVKS